MRYRLETKEAPIMYDSYDDIKASGKFVGLSSYIINVATMTDSGEVTLLNTCLTAYELTRSILFQTKENKEIIMNVKPREV